MNIVTISRGKVRQLAGLIGRSVPGVNQKQITQAK